MVFGRRLLTEAPLHMPKKWEWVLGDRQPSWSRAPACAALHRGTGLAPGPHSQGHSVMGAKLLGASRGLDGALLCPRQREEDGDPRSRHNPADEGPDPAAHGLGAARSPATTRPKTRLVPAQFPLGSRVAPSTRLGPDVTLTPWGTLMSTCWWRVACDGTRTLKEK